MMKAVKLGGILTALVLLSALIALPAAAADKDTLKVGFTSTFATLDHYKSTDRITINIGYSIWDSLVERDPMTGELMPSLARSWKIVNPTTWEFKIQPGVKFHNGNPLTAEAVRFTIEDRILDPAQKSPQAGNYKWIKKVEVVDDVTFRVITQKPYPLVLERFNVLFVYDPIETKAKGDKYVADHPMGSGPYKVVRWERGQQLVLEANPNYWQKGLPKIKNLIIRIIPEASTMVAELISGGIDAALALPPDQVPPIKKAKGVRPYTVPILRINFYQFDSFARAGKSPVMDKRVRQAIWQAIDRPAIIKTVLGGYADVINSPVSPYQFGYDKTVKGYDYNPDKAKALLKEAGHEKGFTLDMWQYEGYQNHPNQAAMGYLSQVGINVNLKDYRGNVGQLIKLRNAGKVTGIGNFTWGSYNIFDADASMPAWFLKDSPQCYNPDPELEKWLLEARFSLDQEARKALYAKAQKKIIDEVYWMPFFAVHNINGVSENLDLVIGRDEVPRLNKASWKK